MKTSKQAMALNQVLCMSGIIALVVQVGFVDGEMKNMRTLVTAKDEVTDLQRNLATISRQLMMQQFYVEEQTRSNGDSGLKQVRVGTQGSRPYYAASHTAGSIASIHDHANNDRTVGMGEFIAVLNGVEFRTRHNDYRLKMKSTTSTEYGATENIPFPPVPPEVTQNLNVDEQIVEMREWFKAWRDQDHTVRDYRPYFKPILCYLEGTWTHSDQNSIDEPFDSDRHHLNANSWLELQEKIRFSSYAGAKDGLENLAYLPTTVIEMLNGTIPVLAQWNFKILCHPLSQDLPLSRLGVVDDLKVRMSRGTGDTLDQYVKSRAARYQIATFDDDDWHDGSKRDSLLDELMEEIPGMDNYPANITEDVFGDVSYHTDVDRDEILNIGYYNRHYRVARKGAMGLSTRHRGFADANLFVSRNTQEKVAGLELRETCKRKNKDCNNEGEKWKWSYAIPLEIVYMTPLSSWNPYNLQHRGEAKTDEGQQIYSGPNGKRNGAASTDKAYNGTNSKTYYRTPCGLFSDEYLTDPADTTKSSTYVLDPSGTPQCTKASGIRVFLPNIPDVGILRQRYPIMPIHGEGSAVWKELEALKEIVLRPKRYQHMMWESAEEGLEAVEIPTDIRFVTSPATSEYGGHKHFFTVSADDYAAMLEGHIISNIVTEDANGHSHEFSLMKRNNKYLIRKCDGMVKCWDGHQRRVFPS